MKKIVFVLVAVLFAKVASAQKELLAFNEQNKYIYYQVVEQPGLTADTFQNRTLYFLKMNYPENKIMQTETPESITGTGRFLILSGLAVAKHVDGEITYVFTIEYKDQKYRYWLTDFVFTPYKVDRYGNSVPEAGVDVPLENGLSKLDKNQLNGYLDKTGAFSKQFSDKIKQYMVRISATPQADTKKKVITTKDW